jgi:hypothetical protein
LSVDDDQAVIINTQKELRRSARLDEQSHRRRAEKKEREESIQLKIADSIRNQVDTAQSTVEDAGKEYLGARAQRKLEKQAKKQLISERDRVAEDGELRILGRHEL